MSYIYKLLHSFHVLVLLYHLCIRTFLSYLFPKFLSLFDFFCRFDLFWNLAIFSKQIYKNLVRIFFKLFRKKSLKFYWISVQFFPRRLIFSKWKLSLLIAFVLRVVIYLVYLQMIQSVIYFVFYSMFHNLNGWQWYVKNNSTNHHNFG